MPRDGAFSTSIFYMVLVFSSLFILWYHLVEYWPNYMCVLRISFVFILAYLKDIVEMINHISFHTFYISNCSEMFKTFLKFQAGDHYLSMNVIGCTDNILFSL